MVLVKVPINPHFYNPWMGLPEGRGEAPPFRTRGEISALIPHEFRLALFPCFRQLRVPRFGRIDNAG